MSPPASNRPSNQGSITFNVVSISYREIRSIVERIFFYGGLRFSSLHKPVSGQHVIRVFVHFGMNTVSFRRILAADAFLVGAFVVIKILLHQLLPEYGFHRDELYYIAIADRFTFSNLDMLPLTPLYLKFFLTLFGHGIKVVHLASSILGAGVIVFGCLIAREFGGKRYAIILTGVFLLFSGLLPFGAIFSYDSMEFLIWVAVFYLLIRIIKYDTPKLWLAIGLLLGLGLLNKLTILFLGLTIFVTLWLVPHRKWFARKWIWIAAGISILCAVPFLLWQSGHDWYFLGFVSGYNAGSGYVSSFGDFLWGQIFPNNIFTLPVWLTGLFLLLFSRDFRSFRIFGYGYLFLFGILFVLRVKFYFMLPVYTLLIAAGSAGIERYFERAGAEGHRRTVLKPAIPLAYLVMSLPFLPYIVPVLPVDQLIGYVKIIGVDAGIKVGQSRITTLPQWMADRFGWEEMVQTVAGAYAKVPDDNRKDVVVIAGNWGECGAVHYYRKKYGLPEPMALDGWFYFDALQSARITNCALTIGVPLNSLRDFYSTIVPMGVFTNRYCLPDENENPVYYCANPKIDLRKYLLISRRVDPPFEAILHSQGAAAAVRYYHEQKLADSTTILFTERQMNALGYRYLRHNQVRDAIALFRLNVEVYPSSTNVYDSLGEAYMAAGEFELAVEYYTRALAMDPRNENAKEKIRELQEKINRKKPASPAV